VCLFAVLVCALSAISGQLRARARLQRQPGASTHTHTHTHTPNTANAHTRISLSRCVSVCVFVCVYTLAHTLSHAHAHHSDCTDRGGSVIGVHNLECKFGGDVPAKPQDISGV
jgi:hypothetical protein